MLIPFHSPVRDSSITYISRAQTSASQNSFTFSSQGIGSADSDRWVIVGAGFYDSSGTTTTVSSVSVGGSSCSELIKTAQALAGSFVVGCGLYAVKVPTGTTADIVVTLSEVVSDCYIGVWSMVAPAYATPSGTDSTKLNTTGTPLSLSVTAPARSVVVGYVMDIGNAASNAWTGLTEDFDFATGSETHSGASRKMDAAASPLAISIARTNPGAGVAAVAVAWE